MYRWVDCHPSLKFIIPLRACLKWYSLIWTHIYWCLLHINFCAFIPYTVLVLHLCCTCVGLCLALWRFVLGFTHLLVLILYPLSQWILHYSYCRSCLSRVVFILTSLMIAWCLPWPLCRTVIFITITPVLSIKHFTQVSHHIQSPAICVNLESCILPPATFL